VFRPGESVNGGQSLPPTEQHETPTGIPHCDMRRRFAANNRIAHREICPGTTTIHAGHEPPAPRADLYPPDLYPPDLIEGSAIEDDVMKAFVLPNHDTLPQAAHAL